MNRRQVQVVDSDDESDNLIKTPKTTGNLKSVKGWSKTKNLQKTDTDSDDGSDSASSNVEKCSPKEEQARVSDGDFFCVGILTVTKVERRLKDTTKDLRVCGQNGKGTHPFKNKSVEGWYCKFCL